MTAIRSRPDAQKKTSAQKRSRLAALVDTLLGPGGPPHKQPANVHELLEYVIRLLEPDLGNNLQLIRDYDTGLPKINLDRDQIIQALINLIRNAAAALEGRGKIILRTRATVSTKYPVPASVSQRVQTKPGT